MQFFHLFSFVVVASYAAALPQPAGLSEKYSNNVDSNLASGLEARSYQPVLNSQRDSATLVLLKRQDDSEGSPENDSEGSPEDDDEESTEDDDEDDYEDDDEDDDEESTEDDYEDDDEESTEDDDESDHTDPEFDTPLYEAGLDTLSLSSTIEEFGEKYVKMPESVKTAAAAVGGGVEETLTKYLKRTLYVSESLKEWEEDSGENLDIGIKSGLGDEEYAKVESSLKEEYEKLKADASGYLKEMTDAVSAIGETPDSVKQEMETIQTSLGHTIDAYKVYFEVLQTQLTRFDAGANLNGHLSDASASLVKFSSKQQKLYDSILQGLETAPSE
ncbi:hypothetical protein BASA81_017906 [Batrachochytrium salamandrivorans]|nr:hypothetical protein BASA81_017906 [Batrachochytrium salamandrivorans]